MRLSRFLTAGSLASWAWASPAPAAQDVDSDLIKRAACQTQATGAGPVPTPDTASAFVAFSAFASAASAAPVPSGYSQTFMNLQAATSGNGYLGSTTLKSYDVPTCAKRCSATNGCVGFNIYYERAPTVQPGADCPNPPSSTFIKCVLWAGPVLQTNALNKGQYRNQFQVVIAGSNGYINEESCRHHLELEHRDLFQSFLQLDYHRRHSQQFHRLSDSESNHPHKHPFGFGI